MLDCITILQKYNSHRKVLYLHTMIYIYIYIYIYMEVLRKMDLKSIKVFIIIEDMGIIGILHAKESFGYQMVLWQLTA